MQDYIPELRSRFARYHNSGTITVTLDGEALDLNNTTITYYFSEDGDPPQETTIEDGTFQFEKGAYGENLFRFAIPNQSGKRWVVEFGHFNTNWWHVNHYNIAVALSTSEDRTVDATIRQTVTIQDGGCLEGEGAATFRENENGKIAVDTAI